MAFAVAALRADGDCRIEGSEAASVSFPEFYHTLAQVEDRAGLDAFAGRMLAPLVDYDRARGTPLLKTLEVYLQRHGNLRQSSRDLHIHLNTLHYRLRRISEVTGVDLKDADARLDLLLALRVRALAETR